MEKGTKNLLGWSEIVLAILITLNQALTWPGSLQYLWAILVVIFGIWTLVAKK